MKLFWRGSKLVSRDSFFICPQLTLKNSLRGIIYFRDSFHFAIRITSFNEEKKSLKINFPFFVCVSQNSV